MGISSKKPKFLQDEFLVVNNQDEGLNDFCLAKILLNYDTNVNERYTKSKTICWVSFN